MPARKHRPEEIIGQLREAEVVLAQGATTAEACRRIATSEQTYYRWRKEYGGLKTDQARRMESKAAVRPTIWRKRMRGFGARYRSWRSTS